MRDILSSLPKIFEGSRENSSATEAIVFAVWKNAVGEALLSHAVPVRLIKRTLLVAVSSETWRRQVTDLTDQMIFKLNASLNAPLVRFIEFRIDPKAVRQHRQKKITDKATEADWNTLVEKAITPPLQRAARSIADESLRKVFLAAAGSSLARGQKRDR